MLFQRKKLQPVVEDSLSDAEQELIRLKAEYSILQNQINPHFLYNTLDSIRSEALLNNQMEIAEMLERLSKFFRYCISSREQLVKISEELQNVENYYYIQKFRFEEKLVVKISVEDDKINDFYIPKLTIQPLIENAIIHGLEGKVGNGTVSIILKYTEKNVYIWVEDDGIGMSEEELNLLNRKIRGEAEKIWDGKKRKGGIALYNVNTRFRLCFGQEYGINVHSVQGEGTDVEVVLPIIDDFTREIYEKKLI